MWFNYEVIELYISVDAQFTWNVTVLVGALSSINERKLLVSEGSELLVVGGEGGGLLVRE